MRESYLPEQEAGLNDDEETFHQPINTKQQLLDFLFDCFNVLKKYTSYGGGKET
jgi:hypothetical protein